MDGWMDDEHVHRANTSQMTDIDIDVSVAATICRCRCCASAALYCTPSTFYDVHMTSRETQSLVLLLALGGDRWRLGRLGRRLCSDGGGWLFSLGGRGVQWRVC